MEDEIRAAGRNFRDAVIGLDIHIVCSPGSESAVDVLYGKYTVLSVKLALL